MKKPQPQTRTILNYSSCRDYICEKYKIDIDDYDRSFEKDETGRAKKFNEGRKFLCFWHYLCDGGGIVNGGTIFITSEMAEGEPEWIQHVISLFVNEFGDDAEYETSW